MKLSSILTLNAISDLCEEKAKETKDEFYTWIAEVLHKTVANDPIDGEVASGVTKALEEL
jgi:hypothetical protein